MCLVPGPVLPELMTSVASVPTRAFTGGPDRLAPWGDGTQFTGPLAVAGPVAVWIWICSRIPTAMSLGLAPGRLWSWLIVK
jgi:hypothetical protein